MLDHFATLQQPRRPWLDPEELKASFHRLSATLHPDVRESGDADQFTALNAAYSTLREPAARLRHLLELEQPELLQSSAEIPEELADLFMQIGGELRSFQHWLSRQNAATTPLARALLAGDSEALRQRFESIDAALACAYQDLLQELQRADELWPATIGDLPLLQNRLTYLAKWRSQVREALFRLG
ncbi:MAG TPA: DnaJ domain-containing protein [Chthoniobacteraceae bacterium]|jgi:curved DNA-binding protein CbpA